MCLSEGTDMLLHVCWDIRALPSVFTVYPWKKYIHILVSLQHEIFLLFLFALVKTNPDIQQMTYFFPLYSSNLISCTCSQTNENGMCCFQHSTSYCRHSGYGQSAQWLKLNKMCLLCLFCKYKHVSSAVAGYFLFPCNCEAAALLSFR